MQGHFFWQRGLELGLNSTDVYMYKGALLSVETLRRHPQMEFCQSAERAGHTSLDIGATLSVQATSWQRGHSFFISNRYYTLNMWQVTGKALHRAAYCMYSLSKIKHYYRARLRNDLPISGWIPPMSTYTRVLCYLWNYHGDTLNCSLLFARTGWPHLPWHCCSNSMLPDGAFLVLFNWLISGDSLYDYRAVAFTVLWCKWSTYMLCTPRTVMQGWGCNTSAIASRWP